VPTPGGVCEHLESASQSLRGAAAWPVELVEDEALGDAVSALAAIESRAASLRMALAGEADRRRIAQRTAETGTDAWVARLTGSTREQAAGGLRLARLLQERYAATGAAFASGRLRVDQVRVIVNAAEQSPPEATAEQVRAAEQWLVDRATGDATRSGRPMDAARLRQTARRMFAHLDHELADRHEAILFGRETRNAEAETYFALHDNGNGTFSGRFVIPELHGHLLKQAIDRLTAPRRLTRDRAGRQIVDEAAVGHDCGANVHETRGMALCELIEHLPAEGWTGHGGNGCEVLVTIDLDALRAELSDLGVAGWDTGVAITAAEARRLACNAGLVPAVLDGASMPLDLGRKQRLHNRTQRRALSLIHDTCAIAGCGRPFAWCEIHHPWPWGRGGPTDLGNGLPVCGHHHRRAHDPRFDLRRRPDGDWAFHRRT